MKRDSLYFNKMGPQPTLLKEGARQGWTDGWEEQDPFNGQAFNTSGILAMGISKGPRLRPTTILQQQLRESIQDELDAILPIMVHVQHYM